MRQVKEGLIMLRCSRGLGNEGLNAPIQHTFPRFFKIHSRNFGVRLSIIGQVLKGEKILGHTRELTNNSVIMKLQCIYITYMWLEMKMVICIRQCS